MPTSTASSRHASDARVAAGPAFGAEERAVGVLLARLRAELPAGSTTRSALSGAAEEACAAAALVDPREAPRVAVTSLLSEALVRTVAETQEPLPAALVAAGASAAQVDPDALGLELMARCVADPRLLGLPPASAIRAIVALSENLAPVAHVSLWQRAAGSLRCLGSAGVPSLSRSVRQAALHALEQPPGPTRRGLLRVLPVPGRSDAVVVVRPARAASGAVPAFVRAPARALAAVLTRLDELDRAAQPTELLAEASERRLARLGFDLHDGPIQSLAALIGDTRLLDTQAAQILSGELRERIASRIGDLQARMVALEFELRCMCHSLESPAVPCRSVERVIEHEVVAFQRQSGIRPDVDVSGDFGDLSPSQRIALLRVVQEALRNVCEHSDARDVSLRIRATADGVDAFIQDNGHGFDVDAALACAVADGRLGLIGMMERVRLLGGRCELRSRPGGPSAVRMALPRWQPQPAAA